MEKQAESTRGKNLSRTTACVLRRRELSRDFAGFAIAGSFFCPWSKTERVASVAVMLLRSRMITL